MLEHGRTAAPHIPRPVAATSRHSQSTFVEHELDLPQLDSIHGDVVWARFNAELTVKKNLKSTKSYPILLLQML
jgi:hypothetical protein